MEEQWDSIESAPKPDHPTWWICLEGGPKDGRRVEVGAHLPVHYLYPAPVLPKALQTKGYTTHTYLPTDRYNKHGDVIYDYQGADVAD